jgi:hypothetical protein
MAKPRFRTVADALLPCALKVHARLTSRGYRVRCEVVDYAAPFTPTISASRESTTLHVNVVGTVDVARIREWVSFGRSTGNDTRVALCIPDDHAISEAAVEELRALGVGVFVANDTKFTERLVARDLALNVSLPDITGLPQRARELLGPAYDKFDRGEWREAFEDAYSALEGEAKRHLKQWSKTGRIKVHSKKGPRQMPPAEISGLTMGQLRDRYSQILTPNQLDSMIEHALERVNPDRIERVHRRQSRRTEVRLRKNVGQHMWLIANVLSRMHE